MSSLLSIISNMSSASNAGSAVLTVAQARLAIAQAEATETTSTSSVSDISGATTISSAAQQAAAAKADNAKNFDVLADEVRGELDTQYAAGTNPAKLDNLSGRALAAMALNQGGRFSSAEIAAAKTGLKQRERDVLTKALSGGTTIATLASYGKTLAENYDATSPEELQALGYTQQTRLNAARMAATTSVTSLFDESN